MQAEVFIGWDPRELLAWRVCARSLIAHTECPPPIRPIDMQSLAKLGLYLRPSEVRDRRLWDVRSNAPMATAFALARFFVPFLTRAPWALFVDGDFMFRDDVHRLLACADPRYAVQVVKHQHQPTEETKMDGQIQTGYPRKNWSSCILWNLRHAAHNGRLTVHDLNHRSGLWLHQFGWLKDEEIGELPAGWNWLEGSGDPNPNPSAVHFTRGTPDMPRYGDVAFASEWRLHLALSELHALLPREMQCAPAA